VSALKSTYVIGLFAGIFLTFIILYGGYITFFTMLLDERFGQSSFQIGIILSGSSVITGLISSQLGRLTLRFRERNLILTAAILYLLIFLIIPAVTNIWWFILPIVLFGVAQGINIPSLLNLITGYALKDSRAAFLSVNWVVMKSGQALGPLLLGIVYLWYGIDGTFYFTALTAVLFILVTVIFVQKV
jgi:MFS transporter, ACDE family, multidrug resistance protein